MKRKPAIEDLLKVMAKLRSPKGCPWDREQTHLSLRRHAIEEVYELIDAIEARDDHEMAEELGDLLLQIVFHCQLARERGAFDFEKVCRLIVEKLIRRHPHVFGKTKVKNVDEVWANWEKIKRAEKHGTKHARRSAFDGIPKHLPALLRAEKLLKKARKSKLVYENKNSKRKLSKTALANELFDLTGFAQSHGWSAEELLSAEIKKHERVLRRRERIQVKFKQAKV
ncbi:MAG: nucleoside triphosphate pyrophosphohydrolase [Limisphaerales bacterium]